MGDSTFLARWRYVVMPDHVHLFCAPADLNPMPLNSWVKFWKSHVARRWLRMEDAPIWQRHFWDTQLRRGENYNQKWEYVVQNPVRAGLVDQPDDWPYQGELSVLPW
jgi:putative transposase